MAARDDPPPVWPPPGEDFYCSDPWGEVQRTRQHVEEEREILRRVQTEHVPFANALMAEYTAYGPSDPHYPTAKEWRSAEEVYNAVQRELNTVKANVRAAIAEAARVEALVREYLNAMEARRVRLGWSGRGRLEGEGFGSIAKALGVGALALLAREPTNASNAGDLVSGAPVVPGGTDLVTAPTTLSSSALTTIPEEKVEETEGDPMEVELQSEMQEGVLGRASVALLDAAGLHNWSDWYDMLAHAVSSVRVNVEDYLRAKLNSLRREWDKYVAPLTRIIRTYCEVQTGGSYPDDSWETWGQMAFDMFAMLLAPFMAHGTVLNSAAKLAGATALNFLIPGAGAYVRPTTAQFVQLFFAAGTGAAHALHAVAGDHVRTGLAELIKMGETLTKISTDEVAVGVSTAIAGAVAAWNAHGALSSQPAYVASPGARQAGMRTRYVVGAMASTFAMHSAKHYVMTNPILTAQQVFAGAVAFATLFNRAVDAGSAALGTLRS